MFPQQEVYRQLREVARQFGDREVRPVLAQHEREERFPWPLVRKLSELGFLGIIIPEAYGGGGLDFWAYCAVLEELGRYSSIRSIASVQQSLVATPLLSFGSEEQKQSYLPKLASGEILGAYALTEPSAGSDAASIRTRAVRDGIGWVINGEKTFISQANVASLFIVFAQTDPEKGHRGITAFLVERSDGVTTSPLKGKLGLRAADVGTVVFQDVRVPDERRLGDVDHGFKIALHTLDHGRVSLAAGAVGISQACLELSVSYGKQRHQFQRPIGSFQLIQDMLADMAVELEAARMLTYKAIAAKEEGHRFTLEASMAKYYATEAANRNAYRAVQIHGGYGFFEDYEVERLYRDARITTLYEGTSQIQKLVIAGHLTGLRAFT